MLSPPSRLLVARLAWSGALLVAPGALFRALGGGEADRTWRIVGRVLGARHLAEALFDQGGGPDRLRLSATVDAIHATSALAFAALDRRRRRVALADAAVAGTFAAWGWWTAAGEDSRRT